MPTTIPTNVVLTEISPGVVQIDWDDTNPQPVDFDVEYTTDVVLVPWIAVATVTNVTTTTHVLGSGIRAHYRVRARIGADSSAYTVYVTIKTSISAPSVISAWFGLSPDCKNLLFRETTGKQPSHPGGYPAYADVPLVYTGLLLLYDKDGVVLGSIAVTPSEFPALQTSYSFATDFLASIGDGIYEVSYEVRDVGGVLVGYHRDSMIIDCDTRCKLLDIANNIASSQFVQSSVAEEFCVLQGVLWGAIPAAAQIGDLELADLLLTYVQNRIPVCC